GPLARQRIQTRALGSAPTDRRLWQVRRDHRRWLDGAQGAQEISAGPLTPPGPCDTIAASHLPEAECLHAVTSSAPPSRYPQAGPPLPTHCTLPGPTNLTGKWCSGSFRLRRTSSI